MFSIPEVKEKETSLSLRVSQDFMEETKTFAGKKGVSQYIREAIKEKNERELAERMKFLSARLSAQSQQINNEFNMAMGDGIA